MEVYNWILLGALAVSLIYNVIQSLMLDAFQKALDEDTPPF